jgi:hypothetical protein
LLFLSQQGIQQLTHTVQEAFHLSDFSGAEGHHHVRRLGGAHGAQDELVNPVVLDGIHNGSDRDDVFDMVRINTMEFFPTLTTFANHDYRHGIWFGLGLLWFFLVLQERFCRSCSFLGSVADSKTSVTVSR